ncbi:hypothetical protein, partial [Bradyrhizobium sp. JYMT SZCCT0428]|uniref:hypothetical protein n=1 Tax=Bradyrhizobium sp. JYMT SZCCT0428 TaxID=2807673 RepID=UPI001BA9B3F0
PAQWLYGLCRDLPGDEWLTPSLPFPLALLRQLDACNGRQDHTVLPYAKSTPSSDVNQRPPHPAARS